MTADALIADDETLIRADVRATLEAMGLAVCAEAADGHQAVRLACHHRPDLIVLDAGMPLIDGVEAARAILAVYQVPIVMLTGYSYGELISRALEVGVAADVVKPYAEATLVEAVTAVLKGDRLRTYARARPGTGRAPTA